MGHFRVLCLCLVGLFLLSGCAAQMHSQKEPVKEISELDLRSAEYFYYNDDADYANVPPEKLTKIADAMILMAKAKKEAAEAELLLAEADEAKAKAAARWTKEERKQQKLQSKLEEKKRKDKLKDSRDRAKKWRDYNKSIRDTADTVTHVVKIPLKPFSWFFDKMGK